MLAKVVASLVDIMEHNVECSPVTDGLIPQETYDLGEEVPWERGNALRF